MEIIDMPIDPIMFILGVVAIYQSFFAKHHKRLARASAVSFVFYLGSGVYGMYLGAGHIGAIKGVMAISFAVFFVSALSWIVLDMIEGRRSTGEKGAN